MNDEGWMMDKRHQIGSSFINQYPTFIIKKCNYGVIGWPNCCKVIENNIWNTIGGLAQLARALDLHSRGQGFDSLILHHTLITILGKANKKQNYF